MFKRKFVPVKPGSAFNSGAGAGSSHAGPGIAAAAPPSVVTSSAAAAAAAAEDEAKRPRLLPQGQGAGQENEGPTQSGSQSQGISLPPPLKTAVPASQQQFRRPMMPVNRLPQPQGQPGAAAPFQKPGLTGLGKPGAGAGAAAGDKTEAKYHRCIYIKKQEFQKKMAQKSYMDGVMSLGPDGAASLYCMENGKVVTSGRAVLTTRKALTAFQAKAKAWSKKAKKGGKGADSDDEDDEEDEEGQEQLYTLGTFVVDLGEGFDAEQFRSGAIFTKTVPSMGGGPMALPTASKGPAKFVPVGASQGLKAAAQKAHTATTGAGAGPTVPKGLYDPHAEGALVVNEAQWAGGKGIMQGPGVGKSPVVPVVVDPYLGRSLRPHQREGVRFMYECVMGLRDPAYTGCILADEMGLGKTLQVLALTWTLLKQGPDGKPAARKAIVVTPATLCANWEKEARRWLGTERMPTFLLGSQKDVDERVLQFKHGSVVRVCITSYETLRKHSTVLAGTFDLLVCDEAHRLKAVGGSKTMQALQELGCARRVLLTGTPVQNNLEEFYALLSCAAPGLLGEPGVFKRIYATPIARGQERDAKPEEKELGNSRAGELNRRVAGFVLRRTQAILAKHLPPLTNYVLFCRLSGLQETIYKHVTRRVMPSLTSSASASDETLAAITALRKLCNHPDLLSPGSSEGEAPAPAPVAPAVPKKGAAAKGVAGAAVGEAGDGGNSSVWLPPNTPLPSPASFESSGKMRVLRALLEAILEAGERVVVVSTSTAALDCIHRLLAAPMGLTVVRIDGSVQVEERQVIVDSFNNLGMGQVFLLSTRAGGAGLNLVGANHLVLFDSDWNPAADLQAMARIWRDGQQRPCSVWRLLASGSIEEKIYQRQIMKGDLASATVGAGETGGGGAGGRHFTREELRQLFTLVPPEKSASGCETRDLLAARAAASAELSATPTLRWLDTGSSPTTAAGGAGGGQEGLGRALVAALATGIVTAACMQLKSEEGLAAGSAAAAGGGAAEAGTGEAGAGKANGKRQRSGRAKKEQEEEEEDDEEEEGEEVEEDAAADEGSEQEDVVEGAQRGQGAAHTAQASAPDASAAAQSQPTVRGRLARNGGGLVGAARLSRGSFAAAATDREDDDDDDCMLEDD